MKCNLPISGLAAAFALVAQLEAADGIPFAPAAPMIEPSAWEALSRGVRQIASPGVPGTVCVFGEGAFPIVVGRAGRDAVLPVVAGGRWGQGRIVVFGHDGYFAPDALKELETGAFLENCIGWAAHGREAPVVAVLRDDRLARHLGACGLKVVAADLERVPEADVVIADSAGLRPAEVEWLAQFIRGGGGFIAAGTGWGWQQLNPGRDLATEHPGNRLLAPAGLVFAAGTLEDTVRDGFSVSLAPADLTHAGRAFTAAAAQAAGRGVLSGAELAQASAVLVAAAHNLPPGDALLLPRLRAIQADPGVHRIPSTEHPIKAEHLFGRLLVTLDGKALRNASVDEVAPHPAAAMFPGPVPASAERLEARVVRIDPRVAGWHSTGLYAAPGERITVRLPAAAVRFGWRVQIGAHTDTTWHLPSWSRFPEITRQFRIEAEVTEAASAFGGLVYVDVPRPSDSAVLEVTISGAVAAPHYVHGRTSVAEWRRTIRTHPAPWGELETRKVVVTLPSSVLRDLDDPAALMEVWDRILDLEADLAAISPERRRPERIVTDEQISAGYMHSGYPIMTFLDQTRNFSSREKLLRGNWGIFHELGHNHQERDWTFEGTVEVTCNLFTLYVIENLGSDRGGNYRHATPEGILRNHRKLTAGGAPDFEIWKRDPFVALSMYAQLKNEFGWEAFKQVFADYRALSRAERPRNDREKRDQWMTRFSRAVGRNLAPFFEVWGVPVSEEAVEAVADLPRWMPAAFAVPEPDGLEEVAPGLRIVRGAVNGALLTRGGKTLAVYGDPRGTMAAVDTVLFTHHRRDVVWAGQALVAAGAKAIVPAAEQEQFTGVREFWSEFETKRFHDYAQQTTKVLRDPMPVAHAVGDGATFTWEGLPIRVLATPGYTRGAVTYLVELEGRRIAFTGDLVYGDGQLLDLYSLQDAIPSAGVGGYHGYAARLGEVLTSLGRVAAEQPDVLVPARGPVIRDPAAAIGTVRDRIRAVYANYLSIDALRWYFKEDHMLAKARRVLGAETKVAGMPMARTQPLPDWIVPISNARLIVAADRTGFLVDCGGRQILDELKQMQAAGKLTAVEHVFVTHYHDDHTDQVAQLVEMFGATVHASAGNVDLLEHPGAHRLPCLTANPIHVSGRAASGTRWKWKEFEMTLYYFPGQTFYHDALLVKKETGEEYFFIGDSFTPSGIDDYCLLNRNLLHEGTGYLRCLEHVKRVAPDALLINQHVGPAFRFSGEQLDHMLAVLRERVRLLEPLFPWGDPNFGLDEGWARFHPYASEVDPGETLTLRLRLMNHLPRGESFRVNLRGPAGWEIQSARPNPVRLHARQEGSMEWKVTVPRGATPGLQLFTADLAWGQWDLREWTEAMVTVRPPENRRGK